MYHTLIVLAASDPDNDEIKCRYARIRKDECHKTHTKACGPNTDGLQISVSCIQENIKGNLLWRSSSQNVGGELLYLQIFRSCTHQKILERKLLSRVNINHVRVYVISNGKKARGNENYIIMYVDCTN